MFSFPITNLILLIKFSYKELKISEMVMRCELPPKFSNLDVVRKWRKRETIRNFSHLRCALSFITISHVIIAFCIIFFNCVNFFYVSFFLLLLLLLFSRYFAKSMELAHLLQRNGMRKVYARLKT